MKRNYSYEDEKRDALASYLSSKSDEFKYDWEFKERDLKLMKIKIDLQIIARSTVKRFNLRCKQIVTEICAAQYKII